LSTVFLTAKSEADFYQQVTQKGLHIYQRRGKNVGIQTKRKYRFKTLGYPPELVQQIGQDLTKHKRLALLEKIRKNQHYDKDRRR